MEAVQPRGDTGNNRRVFGRMMMRLAPALVVLGREGERTVDQVRLVDLSTTGAQILIHQPPPIGGTLWLRLTEPRRNVDLTLTAEVMWTAPLGDRWRTGVRFSALAPEATSTLARWLFHLHRQTAPRQQTA